MAEGKGRAGRLREKSNRYESILEDLWKYRRENKGGVRAGELNRADTKAL